MERGKDKDGIWDSGRQGVEVVTGCTWLKSRSSVVFEVCTLHKEYKGMKINISVEFF